MTGEGAEFLCFFVVAFVGFYSFFLFLSSCFFCLSLLAMFVAVFVKEWTLSEDGASFFERGVVVGGGFRTLPAPRTLRAAGCLEFG